MEKHETTDYPQEGDHGNLCLTPETELKKEPFALVIFGGAGDYTRRMIIPSLYHLRQDGFLVGDYSVIGFGLPAMSEEEYRAYVHHALDDFSSLHPDSEEWKEFAGHFTYISSGFDHDEGYETLYRRLGEVCLPGGTGRREVIFYLAVPPSAAPVIIANIKKHRLCDETIAPKIIMEKPFGRDRASAVKLNDIILDVFDENQIYRVDHYLGKEAVQNIRFFRFANSMFEPLWDRKYVDHVEITVAEQIGIEHRGAFYEETGVIRDVVQNHMMQLVSLVAMEPPVRFEADLIRDEKVKVIRSIRALEKEDIDRFTVRGQYGPGVIEGVPVKGYRQEEHVSPDSSMPTFFAAKIHIDNWRWDGVPIFLRTGKRLEQRRTEIVIHFKQAPLRLFGRSCENMKPNSLRFNIQPQEFISLCMSVKHPGVGNIPYPVTMDFHYDQAFPIERHSAHERLLLDCLKGDLSLFARQDGVEAMWTIVDPIIERWQELPPQFPNYPAGSWGPSEADALMEKEHYTWSNVQASIRS
ncbi:MAG: glucose-6-phosphate dehydrogenase [Desulfomonilia bacterium]|nr:glucose-6-phosphate dehydrogenase [Desulfomonilia bacterium]